jgi:hypothetical protein
MIVDRRQFLTGISAAAVTAALPVSAQALRVTVPQLICDGEHDDTDGLQALVDGLPVDIHRGAKRHRDGRVVISNCIMKITRPVTLRGGRSVEVTGVHFLLYGESVFVVIADDDKVAGLVMTDWHVERMGPRRYYGAAWVFGR